MRCRSRSASCSGSIQKFPLLTRRIGENLKIGDSVTVAILAVHGSQVRVGITAPKEIPVHREEIYERIKRELDADSSKD